MSNNYGANDTVVGYITNVSNENKKKKHFIKFTMLSEDNQSVDGWVFSSMAGILATPLGIALCNSFKNKTGLKLWGTIEHTQASCIFRMQSWSKFQIVNLNFQLQIPSNNVTFINEALMISESNAIRIFVLDVRPSENFDRQGVIRTFTFVLVGDQTGTTYLVATDLKPDVLKIEHTYDITKVRKKIFNGSSILTTTINTNISLSNLKVNPDVNHVETTMKIDLTDIKTVETTISEVGPIERLASCATCTGNLHEVTGASSLMMCTKCHRHSLKINITQQTSTTIVLKNDEEKLILFVNDRIFNKILDVTGLSIDMIDTDLFIGLISYTDLIYTYSQLRKELLDIAKPQRQQ